mmetsp:Transcript_15297/g.23036  ORF Transcript_15297/g.23036 Transcript_15297/m.23036 type:complete len:208 (+) Transcript_15297:31-654(+)
MSTNSSSNSNLFWHGGEVLRSDRNHLLGHKGATLWFTGLSGCGKSTLAVHLETELFKRGKICYRLDGDNIRLGINRDLGFTEKDREENIRRIGEVAKLFADAGLIVLCSFVSPYIRDRNNVRDHHTQADIPFYEIYVDCPLSEAEARDPKGLYKKARAGEIPNFTGISDPYEAPPSPEIHIHSNVMSVEEESEAIIRRLDEDGILTT